MPIANLQKGSRVLVLVRPEEVTLQPSDSVENANGTDNRIAGFIELRTFLGPFTRFHIKVNGDMTLTADIPSQQARGYFVGQNVVLSFPHEACQVLALDEAEVELSKQAQAEAVFHHSVMSFCILTPWPFHILFGPLPGVQDAIAPRLFCSERCRC